MKTDYVVKIPHMQRGKSGSGVIVLLLVGKSASGVRVVYGGERQETHHSLAEGKASGSTPTMPPPLIVL